MKPTNRSSHHGSPPAGRLLTIFAGLAVVYALLVLVSFRIQVVGSREVDRMANRQLFRNIVKLPRRGDITDRNGAHLAISVRVKSLYANTREMGKSRSRVAEKLSVVLGVSKASLEQRMRQDRDFVWVRRHLPDHLVTAIHSLKLPGLHFVEEDRRSYPAGNLAAHLIGLTNIDGVGIDGLEKAHDTELAGERDAGRFKIDGKGRIIFNSRAAVLEPADGKQLQLTIDKGVQHYAEQGLASAAERFQILDGSIVVLDVPTGEVLGLASYPSFDPNHPNRAMPGRRRNRAYVDTFEPGSTLKTILLAGALERGVYSKDSIIFCENGKFRVQDRWVHESEERHRWGNLSVAEIIKMSSNIGSAKMALQLGAAVTTQIYRDFGFGSPSGIPVPGEAPGRVPSPSDIKPIRLANMGFGHGLTTTALQIAAAYNVIASGGEYISPRLIRDQLRPDARRVISQGTAATMRKILLSVTEDPKGTGSLAKVPGYSVAGKTGTAQKVEQGRYVRGKYVASFAGMVPAENPRYVIVVTLNEPSFPYYGGLTAAPIFSEVASSLLLQKGTRPDQPFLLTSKPKGSPEAPNTVVARNSRRSPETSVPSLVGMTLRESLQKLGPLAAQARWKGTGVVVSQSIPSGSNIGASDPLDLVLSDPE